MRGIYFVLFATLWAFEYDDDDDHLALDYYLLQNVRPRKERKEDEELFTIRLEIDRKYNRFSFHRAATRFRASFALQKTIRRNGAPHLTFTLRIPDDKCVPSIRRSS